MIQHLGMIWRALFAGYELKRAASWKNIGALISIALPLIWAASKAAASWGWIPMELTQEELDRIGEWLWSGSGILTAYWFRATSTRVGWPAGQEVEQRPGPDEYFTEIAAPPGDGILLRPDGLRHRRELQGIGGPGAVHRARTGREDVDRWTGDGNAWDPGD